MSTVQTFFAPQLCIPSGTTDISFYTKGLGATELRSWKSDDGSYHVAELSIDGVIFHVHEDNESKQRYSPSRVNGCTTIIGLFVADVDLVINNAVAAGAKLTEPAQDYDYGYRQGNFIDPFGHEWLIEKKI